ncbi:hypothetical protein ACFVU2_21050 [Leifsonia sp. NPDC058194]|uniref:hypothetical protein n=1 Tax=Leifsonia sp. NPDC058194 TaxID=3346374 RepID=UPI0036DE25E5
MFTNTPTQTAADLNAARAFTEKLGNRIQDTAANRTAPGAPAWLGLEWFETDTGLSWLYTSSGWIQTLEDTGWITPTTEFASGWVTFTDTIWTGFRYRRLNRVTYLAGAVSKASYTALDTIMTLPAGFRPALTIPGPAANSGQFTFVRSDGSVCTAITGTTRIPIMLSFPV